MHAVAIARIYFRSKFLLDSSENNYQVIFFHRFPDCSLQFVRSRFRRNPCVHWTRSTVFIPKTNAIHELYSDARGLHGARSLYTLKKNEVSNCWNGAGDTVAAGRSFLKRFLNFGVVV